MIDLSKPYDGIPHDLLPGKLNLYVFDSAGLLLISWLSLPLQTKNEDRPTL